jgi:MFS family permease
MNEAAPGDRRTTKLPTNVKLLGLASLLNDVASEMIFPLLPQFFLGVLHGDKSLLGLMEGLADSIGSLLRLWSGAWSDRAGWRKGFVVFGYGVTALVRPLAGIVGAPWQLIGIRVTDRIGKGVRTSPRDALIADSTDPMIRGRAFGFHQAMDHLGAAIGPLLATLFLLRWPEQLRTLFLLAVIPGLAVVALLVFGLREVPSKKLPPEHLHLTIKPFGWRFRLYLVALVLFTLGNSSDAFVLVRAKELGVSEIYLPLLWCAFHIVKSSANLLAGRASDHLGPRPVLIAGWVLYGAAYLAFAFAANAWQAWVIFLAYGFIYSLTEPASKAFVGHLTPSERKGLAFGWFNFAVGIAALPSSLIFGWLYQQFGGLVAFGWGAMMAVVAAMILFAIRSPRSKTTGEHAEERRDEK